MSRMISETMYNRVVAALKSFEDKVDNRCAETSCFCTLPRQEPCCQWIKELIEDLQKNNKKY